MLSSCPKNIKCRSPCSSKYYVPIQWLLLMSALSRKSAMFSGHEGRSRDLFEGHSSAHGKSPWKEYAWKHIYYWHNATLGLYVKQHCRGMAAEYLTNIAPTKHQLKNSLPMHVAKQIETNSLQFNEENKFKILISCFLILAASVREATLLIKKKDCFGPTFWITEILFKRKSYLVD